MPEPLGVVSSLLLYSIIPSVPFVGYSIAVPTVLSLQPVADGCSPHIVIYLLASYALAYCFLMFSFSIALFPLPGCSCFHRLDVKLLSLASLSLLHLLSLAHAVVFLLLPAYVPSALSSLVDPASSSDYLPLPLSSTCATAPSFYAALAGVGVQLFYLLWLLCTVVIAWGQEQCWAGWTAEELREIDEAQARHALWRAERDEERRKLIDGQWYTPANAVTQQRTEKPTNEQAEKDTATVPKPPPRLSVSNKHKDMEEEKEQEEDEDEILRYTQRIAATRRKEREKEEQKEQDEELEDETEDDEEDNDEQSEYSDVDEPFSASSSSSSSSTSASSSTASAAAASEQEDDENGGSNEELEQRENHTESLKHRTRTERRRSEENESEPAGDDDGDIQQQDEDVSDKRNDMVASERDEGADEQPTEEAGGLTNEEVDQSGAVYSDQYGAVAGRAPSSRSAAAPALPSKAIKLASAAPLLMSEEKKTVVEEPQPIVHEPAIHTPRRLSHPMPRTVAVRQPAEIFGATVPLAKVLPSAAPATAARTTRPAAELPSLPPMPTFASTAPITIPALSLLPSPSLSQTPPFVAPTLSTPPPLSATFSSRTPPLPIVTLPLRRPQLTPLSLQPPLPITTSSFGRTTASSSPPLPISPMPLSPKAFLATASHSLSSPPLPIASPPLSSHPVQAVADTAEHTISAFPTVPPPAISAPDDVVTVSAPTLHSHSAVTLPLESPSRSVTEFAPAERQRPPFVPLHTTQELQLVAELKGVHQQRNQQPLQQNSGPTQPSHDGHERQQETSTATDTADAIPNHESVDASTEQQHQHQQRLSGTGQFVVETSDGSLNTADEQPTLDVAVDQPVQAAVDDEISFSDDEDGADESRVAEQQPQAPVDGAGLHEHSVVLEEEVEEEVF